LSKPNLIIAAFLSLFIGQSLLGQTDLAKIDLDDPSEEECYQIDSALSLPNN
jgi:hypothetical protein